MTARERKLEDFIDYAIEFALIFGVPGYFVIQIWWPLRMRGGWRVASLVPLIVLVPLLIHALVALAMDSNLWPIMIVFFAPVGFLYLAIVGIAHYLRN